MKFVKIFLSIAFIFFVFLLSGCSLSYNLDKNGNMDIGYSKQDKEAFIAHVYVDLDTEIDIVLPDTYKNCTVTKLGGYIGRGVPCPFEIIYKVEDENIVDKFSIENDYLEEYSKKWSSYETITITCNVKLPKNLKKLYYMHVDDLYVVKYKDEDNKIKVKVYKTIFKFEIDKDNKLFYTKDGKLYYKLKDELVTKFIYE